MFKKNLSAHLRGKILAWLLALILLAFTATASGSNYVVVSDSGRYFQLEDGTDFLPLGYDQMPDFPESLHMVYDGNNLDYDKEELREYFNMMHDHGVNVLRVWGEAPDIGYRYMLLEDPAGVINPAFERFFDDIFELAEDYKIYILLTPYDTFWQHDKWYAYPYNAYNGGPCHGEDDGLTTSECFEYQKARMKWFVDRYGNSDYLFGWDIMNEIDWTWGGQSGSTIRAWTDRMTSWLIQYERQKWGKNHLITLNTAGCPTSGDLEYSVFRHPNVDFATNHMYYSNIASPPDVIAPAVTVNQYVKLALNQFAAGDMRPFFDSESGPIDGQLPASFDNIYYHNMIWAHLSSGGAGSNLRWPFRLFAGPTDEMFDSILAMSKIIKHIKWSQFASENIDNDVSVTDTGGHTVIDMACGDSFTALVFILQDSRYTTGNISGAELTVSDMTAGTYLVKCFDSYTGDIISEEKIDAVSGNVVVNLPDFEKDIVVILVNHVDQPTVNRKPDAWITSPAAGTGTGQVSSITVSADTECADDASISLVQFWANYDNGSGKQWRLLDTDITAPYIYEWDISSLPDQKAVEFRVQVFDSKGSYNSPAMGLYNYAWTETTGGVTLEGNSDDVTDGYGSIEYPPVNAVIDKNQTVTLKARAWDISSGVNKVEFWIQGTPSSLSGATSLGEDSSPTDGVYTLDVDLSGYTDSTRWISLDVIDNQGNDTTPADLHTGITLDSSPTDNTAPKAVFTSPSAGDVFTSGPITVSVDASDDLSGVDRVEFWANYSGGWHNLGSDSSEPYSILWTTPPSSSQKLMFSVDVYDNQGNSETEADRLSGIFYEGTAGDIFDPWCHIYSHDAHNPAWSSLNITAIAGDRGSSSVKSVLFMANYDGGWHVIGSDLSEPYECTWNADDLPHGTIAKLGVNVDDSEGNIVFLADTHEGIRVNAAGDISRDEKIDYDDLVILFEQWLQTPGEPSADIAPQPYGDGDVNFEDLAELAEDWLAD